MSKIEINQKFSTARDARSRSGWGYQHTSWKIIEILDNNKYKCEVLSSTEEDRYPGNKSTFTKQELLREGLTE